jgi:hypothetical protein
MAGAEVVNTGTLAVLVRGLCHAAFMKESCTKMIKDDVEVCDANWGVDLYA